MQITVEGTKSVIAKLEATGPKVMIGAGRAVEELGMSWETTAKLEATRVGAVDTGRYRASIGHWSGGLLRLNPEATAADAHWDLQTKLNAIELEVGTNVDYADYVERMYGVFGRATDIISWIAVPVFTARINEAMAF